MEKIPCIKCTPELWEYIKPYLKKWNYFIQDIDSFDTYPLLVINRCQFLGICTNLVKEDARHSNRELVANVEEFLERAAELKGFTYKRKGYIMKINGIEIKPGMGIYLNGIDSDNLYIVFPTKQGLAVTSYGKPFVWDNLKAFLCNHERELVAISDIPNNDSIMGKILWEKPKEVVLTMQEIADKFGVSVEQLMIKE